MDSFSDHLKQHIESVRAEVKETGERAKLGQVLSAQQEKAARAKYDGQRLLGFDAWASNFELRVREGWEFSDMKPELEDYGVAQWKSRQLPAIAVRVEFPMVQRAMGDRRTDCEVFFWVNDEEFGFRRQSGVAACSKYDSDFLIWSQQNAFESQWKLLSPVRSQSLAPAVPEQQSSSARPLPPSNPPPMPGQQAPVPATVIRVSVPQTPSASPPPSSAPSASSNNSAGLARPIRDAGRI